MDRYDVAISLTAFAVAWLVFQATEMYLTRDRETPRPSDPRPILSRHEAWESMN